MRMSLEASLGAAVIIAASVISPVSALAQGAPKIDGAYVGLGVKCEDVFIKTKGGYRFSPKRNAFDTAFLIRGKSLSTPIATCQLSRAARKGQTLDLTLQCANDVSYAPVKAFLRVEVDGGLTRLAQDGDTGGDKYEKCAP